MEKRFLPTPRDWEALSTYLKYWRMEAQLCGRGDRRWWRIYLYPGTRIHNWRAKMGFPPIHGPIGHGFKRNQQDAIRFAVRRALAWTAHHEASLPRMQDRDTMPAWVGTQAEQLARGRAHERRALRILQMTRLPPWIGRPRAGTLEEDARGIDIVVDSTVGPLYLQIKSSVEGMHTFFEKGYHEPVEVLVINERKTDRTFLAEATAALDRLWKQRRAEQRAAEQTLEAIPA